LTHGTIFVKDNVDFNENLASFIGNKGAILFLKQKYGAESKELINYLAHKEDELKIEKYMLSCAHRLDSLYQQMLPELNLNLKNNYKKQMFNSFIENAKTLVLSRDSLFPSRLQKRINNAGNAFIMHYVRYGSKQHDFEEEFKKFNGDLFKYVELMKVKHLKN
jgi:predicted aminopeptidase